MYGLLVFLFVVIIILFFFALCINTLVMSVRCQEVSEDIPVVWISGQQTNEV